MGPMIKNDNSTDPAVSRAQFATIFLSPIFVTDYEFGKCRVFARIVSIAVWTTVRVEGAKGAVDGRLLLGLIRRHHSGRLPFRILWRQDSNNRWFAYQRHIHCSDTGYVRHISLGILYQSFLHRIGGCKYMNAGR